MGIKFGKDFALDFLRDSLSSAAVTGGGEVSTRYCRIEFDSFEPVMGIGTEI